MFCTAHVFFRCGAPARRKQLHGSRGQLEEEEEEEEEEEDWDDKQYHD